MRQTRNETLFAGETKSCGVNRQAQPFRATARMTVGEDSAGIYERAVHQDSSDRV